MLPNVIRSEQFGQHQRVRCCMAKFCVVACRLRSSYVVTEDCSFLVYGIWVDTDVSEKYFVGYAAVCFGG